MKMNEKIIRYLDGEMSPEEKTDFEKEKSVSIELQEQFSLFESTLKQTVVLHEAKISNDYFVNMIPLFRNKKTEKRDSMMNPAFAGGLLMILIFLITLVLYNDMNTISTINYDIASDQFSQEEIYSMLNDINFDTSEFDLSSSEELNIDSMITRYITNDILSSSGNESADIQIFDINPDEIQISDSETDNLFAVILNKKFF